MPQPIAMRRTWGGETWADRGHVVRGRAHKPFQRVLRARRSCSAVVIHCRMSSCGRWHANALSLRIAMTTSITGLRC